MELVYNVTVDLQTISHSNWSPKRLLSLLVSENEELLSKPVGEQNPIIGYAAVMVLTGGWHACGCYRPCASPVCENASACRALALAMMVIAPPLASLHVPEVILGLSHRGLLPVIIS